MSRNLDMMKMFPIPPKDEDILCPYCEKKPDDLHEYITGAEEYNNEFEADYSALDWMRMFEGTYDKYTGLFACNNCYIKIGQPTREKLLGAYPYYRMEVSPLEGQDHSMCVKYRLGEDLD